MMNSWTFETKEIAETFDAHVREQLPWYDMVTDAVVYITRNYLPDYGVVVDIGASTGNMIDKLMPLTLERVADVVAIEKSLPMCAILKKKYNKKSDCVVVENADVTKGDLPKADVYILFLTMMFIPIEKRKALIDDMRANCKQGGVIVVVDKICDHGGYFATVLKRLTMQFKLQQGAKPEDVLNKEMSLAGVQIPIDPSILGSDAKQFFRMGEFAGWVIEK
jgi:tRNA (cmo5U34)-methyltransferase